MLVTDAAAPEPPIAPDDFSKGLDVAREISHDVGQWQALHDLAEVLPVADLVFGGGILVIVVLIHAAGLRAVGDHVSRRVDAIRARPTLWHADLLMSSIVFLLLALHLSEIFVWSAALVFSGLVPNWHNAGFFAGNTYTTIGYGTFLLPPGWEMVAPIMAISGLFAFGWTGSVLVDYVRRIHEIRDAAHALRDARRLNPPPVEKNITAN